MSRRRDVRDGQRPGGSGSRQGRVVEEGAVVDALAAAGAGVGQPGAHALGAVDQRVDLGQAPRGELAQPLVHRVVAVLDELADLPQRQPGALSDVDDRQATQDALVVATLATYAWRLGERPMSS